MKGKLNKGTVSLKSLLAILCAVLCTVSLIDLKTKAATSYAEDYEDAYFQPNVSKLGNKRDEKNPDKYIAYTINAEPDLDGYVGSPAKKFDCFIIDFRAEYAPVGTLWKLCDFTMNTDAMQSAKYSKKGGKAYAGLLMTDMGPLAVLSMEDITFANNKKACVSVVDGALNSDNRITIKDGVTNLTTRYNWKADKWYRMMLTCYDDAKTGYTFVEMHVLDIEKGVWTKIACFNTGVYRSYIDGDLSQSMENIDYRFLTYVRSFEFANICARDRGTNEWISGSRVRFSLPDDRSKMKGQYGYGSSRTSYWGITGGYGEKTAPATGKVYKYESVYYFVGNPKVSMNSLNIKEIENTPQGIQLSWNALPGAQGYNIYWRKNNSGSWYSLAYTRNAGYTDLMVNSNTHYQYKVVADIKNRTLSGIKNQDVKEITYLREPRITEVASTSSGVVIKWENMKSYGAKSYEVYRSYRGKVELLATVTDTNFLDKNCILGENYYYEIRAISGDGYKSAFSNSRIGRWMKAPEIKSIMQNYGGVCLSVLRGEGVNYITFYRREEGKQEFEECNVIIIADYYVDRNVKSGKTYEYKVRGGLGSSSDNNVYSEYSATKSITLKASR